jgi:hypothetical protein
MHLLFELCAMDLPLPEEQVLYPHLIFLVESFVKGM